MSELEARLAAQIEESKKLAARHEQEIIGRTVLDEQLLRMLPLVHEANAISGELGKGLRFAVKLISKTIEIDSSESGGEGDSEVDLGSSVGSLLVGVKGKLATEVAVLVHHDDDISRDAVMWSANKFNDRIYLMREVYQLWVDGGETFENNLSYQSSIFSNPSGDPFYDPPEDTLVGVAYLQLEAVRWLLDMKETTPLVDYRGQSQGEVSVELVPYLSNISGEEVEYEDLAEVPTEEAMLELEVNLISAQSLPRKFITPSRSCYLSFKFPTKHITDKTNNSGNSNKGGSKGSDETLIMRTPRMPLTTQNPSINHTQRLSLNLTPDLVEYLTTSAISFEVWVSVDPPGNWVNVDEQEDDEEYIDSDDDSDDEGIPAHGIAMVRSQGGQRKREREWQLQRQGQAPQEIQQFNKEVDVPTVSLEEHQVLIKEVKCLKEENKSLREQLDHAMHLIASQTPIPDIPATVDILSKENMPAEDVEVINSHPNESTVVNSSNPPLVVSQVVITGKSARRNDIEGNRRKIELAKNLDREINGQHLVKEDH